MPFRYATVRYVTDPARIARMLPPGLVAGEQPEIFLDFLVIDFGDARNVFFPDPYHESAIWIRCRLEDADESTQDGYYLLEMPLDQDWGRSTGREFLALSKKDGHIELDVADHSVRAILRRRGKELCRLEATLTDGPAAEAFWLREVRDGGYGIRARLNADWRKGLLRHGADLVRHTAGLESPPSEAPHEGKDVPRALADIRLSFPDPSLLDPIAELPVLKVIGGAWFANEGSTYSFGSGRKRREGTDMSLLRHYEATEIEPWALWGHDRPVSDGDVWMPQGWPGETTAALLTIGEIRGYRERDAFNLAGTMIDIRLKLDASVAEAVLPDGLNPSADPQARIMFFEASQSDVSPVPFTEAWLLSRCSLEGREAWYALDHVVGDGGDVMFGREAFGYPSKLGEVQMGRDVERIRVRGRRAHRTFVECELPNEPKGATSMIDTLTVVGVQADSFTAGRTGRIIAQPWAVTGRLAEVPPSQLRLALPRQPGPANVGLPNPWFEVGGDVLSVRVGDSTIARMPGRVVREVDSVFSLVRERFDGAASIAEITGRPASPSYRLDLKKGAAT